MAIANRNKTVSRRTGNPPSGVFRRLISRITRGKQPYRGIQDEWQPDPIEIPKFFDHFERYELPKAVKQMMRNAKHSNVFDPFNYDLLYGEIDAVTSRALADLHEQLLDRHNQTRDLLYALHSLITDYNSRITMGEQELKRYYAKILQYETINRRAPRQNQTAPAEQGNPDTATEE